MASKDKEINVKRQRPSKLGFKILIERLREEEDEAEKGTWAIWGLLSTWNPFWRNNQLSILELSKTTETHFVREIARNMARRNSKLCLYSMGALTQFAFLNADAKREIAADTRVMGKLQELLSVVGMDMTYDEHRLQYSAACLLSALTSAPTSADVCLRVATNDAIMNNLNNLARTGSEALNQTIVDIVFGLSFHHEVQQHLVRHRYTQLMLRMLEQSQGRTSAFLKVAIAIVNFTERSHVRSFVGQQCVSMLLSALTVIVREEVLVLEDQKLLGCFSTTSLEDSHDAASKIYSLHVLYPLSILSSHEEIHESLRGKRFLANLKEFVNMYHRRIISKQVQDTPEAASIMRIVQILSNLQRTPDGQQAIKTSNLPGALVKIFEDQHVEIRGEMCKFVHSCPLLWEEERDKVLPILFSLLGDKSAEVRREAMHAVSEIFHVRATRGELGESLSFCCRGPTMLSCCSWWTW